MVKVGTVVWENVYRYYPNGDPNEFVLKQQCRIQYPDGSMHSVSDTEYEGSGVVSPLIKFEK